MLYAKLRKGFLKINDSVKYYLEKWIISHPHVIQYPIESNCIEVKFDDGNRGVKTELSQKVILQLYVHELHIDMLNKYATGFSMEYYE